MNTAIVKYREEIKVLVFWWKQRDEKRISDRRKEQNTHKNNIWSCVRDTGADLSNFLCIELLSSRNINGIFSARFFFHLSLSRSFIITTVRYVQFAGNCFRTCLFYFVFLFCWLVLPVLRVCIRSFSVPKVIYRTNLSYSAPNL